MSSSPVPLQPTEVVEPPISTPGVNPDATQPAQTDKENVPLSDPVSSSTTPQVDNPTTPTTNSQVFQGTGEGEEKHDWEVVNASPSHSPSKDGANEGPAAKGKGREREKSNTSTFGKDGKIGQKIDGVKKVLKSGVFGSSPKSTPVITRPSRTSTKPPVPPARAVPSKLSSSAASTPAPKTAKSITAPLPRSGRPSVAATKPLASSTSKVTETGGPKPLALASSVSSATIRPSTSTSTVKPRSTIAPRASISTAKTASVPTSRVTSDSQKSAATNTRRESNASIASNKSSLANPSKPAVKPRASMPASTKPATRGAMGPPAMATTRSVPARGSVVPGSFATQNKVADDLKAKIVDLDKQLADKTKEHEDRLEVVEKEKKEMTDRHAKEIEAIQQQIGQAEQKTTDNLWVTFSELQSTHEKEMSDAREEQNGVVAGLKAKVDEMTAAHAQLLKELKSTQDTLGTYETGLQGSKELHAQASDSLAELRAAKRADDKVLDEVKAQLSQKGRLLSEAIAKLQITARIEETLRNREAEIERLRAEHQEQLATLREQSSGTDEANKAINQAELERLEERIIALEENDVGHKNTLQKLDGLVDQLQQELDTVRAAHQEAVASSQTLQARTIELETELAAAQEKHDGLLLEAAQLSDAKIAELSEQLQHATSLKNEAVAELEQEREQASGSEELRKRLMVKEAEASAKVKELEEEVEKLHAELIDQRREHEDKFASAIEEARNSAVEEHSQDLILLREELTATHTQLVTTHRAEIEHQRDLHSMAVREQQEAHQDSIDELQNLAAKVAEKAEEDLDALRQVVLRTQHTLDKAEEENRELMAKLEEATINAQGGTASEESLKEALRKIGELREELDDTKTMADMDKSHFATMLESIKEDHIAAFGAHTKDADEKLEAMRQEHDAVSDRSRRELETAKAELEVERQVGKTLSEELQALRKRMEQWSTEASVLPKAETESKTPKKGRHSNSSSLALSGQTGWDFGSEQDSEAETGNSSYITARAEQSSIRAAPAPGGTRGSMDGDSESGESGSEGKDTDDSHYPSSLSDDGQHIVLPSPDTTPEQPEVRRRMAVRIASGLPAGHLDLDTSSEDEHSSSVAHAAGIPLPTSNDQAYGGLEEMSFEDMTTPNASTFNQKLPATEAEGEEVQADTSPTPRKVSIQAKDDDEDEVKNLLQLQKE